MDMSMMGAMDMSSDGGLFTTTNMRIARGYWYGVAAIVALLGIIRLIDTAHEYCNSRRQTKLRNRSPSLLNPISQAYATITAVFREITYPQPLVFLGPLTKHLSPPPIGRIVMILIYWSILLTFLWTGVILKPGDPLYGYKWEKVAFRAAWVSVTQVPLIYCLSCKINVISIISGISYERLNWLHRWSALTLFFTVIVHWSFFFNEWSIADIVSMELSIMPMVKYGFGSWAVIGWMTISGWGFFRELAYEFFVLQHILSAGILLWLLHVHVPHYARYNIWIAVTFIVFDRGVRGLWLCYRNAHLIRRWTSKRWSKIGLGYKADLEELPGEVTKVTVRDIDFSWTAGQHVFISIPTLGFFESHPFTIANTCRDAVGDEGKALDLYIKAHAGFTKRLLRKASVSPGYATAPTRVFISGPWGYPPSLRTNDTVVLIAASTGATFTIPLFQDLAVQPGSVRSISFHWIIRSQDRISWFRDQLIRIVEVCNGNGVAIDLTISITGQDSMSDSLLACCCRPQEENSLTSQASSINEKTIEPLLTQVDSNATSLRSVNKPALHVTSTSNACNCGRMDLGSNATINVGCRPSMDSIIRKPVEEAFGETAIVVCGGEALTAATRTYVSSLSDERAVHKGTGAKGIFLFTESFGW